MTFVRPWNITLSTCKRYKDTIKSSLKAVQIDPSTFEEYWQPIEAAEGTRTIRLGCQRFEEDRIHVAREQRRTRKERERHQQHSPLPDTAAVFPYDQCGRSCLSKIGLFSYTRWHTTRKKQRGRFRRTDDQTDDDDSGKLREIWDDVCREFSRLMSQDDDGWRGGRQRSMMPVVVGTWVGKWQTGRWQCEAGCVCVCVCVCGWVGVCACKRCTDTTGPGNASQHRTSSRCAPLPHQSCQHCRMWVVSGILRSHVRRVVGHSHSRVVVVVFTAFVVVVCEMSSLYCLIQPARRTHCALRCCCCCCCCCVLSWMTSQPGLFTCSSSTVHCTAVVASPQESEMPYS